MRHSMRYAWIGYTAARSAMAYRAEVILRCSFLTVILYIFMRMWTVVYAGENRVAGLTLPQMLWYLMITQAIFGSSPRVWAEVDDDVRTGRLAVQLIHPVSYVGAHLSRDMGARMVRFTINLLVGITVTLLLVGPIQISASGLAMFAIVLPAAFLLDFLGMFLVGLGAFWLESTAGLALIYNRLVMLLGGMVLPLEIYPEVLRPVLRFLPFSSMVSAPARIFVDPSFELFLNTIGTLAVAVVFFMALVATVQSIALRRLFANGG